MSLIEEMKSMHNIVCRPATSQIIFSRSVSGKNANHLRQIMISVGEKGMREHTCVGVESVFLFVTYTTTDDTKYAYIEMDIFFKPAISFN